MKIILLEHPHIVVSTGETPCAKCPTCGKHVCMTDPRVELWNPPEIRTAAARKYNHLMYEKHLFPLVCENRHIFFYSDKDDITYDFSPEDLKSRDLLSFVRLLRANIDAGILTRDASFEEFFFNQNPLSQNA